MTEALSSAPFTPLEQGLALLEAAVSPVCGIVTGVTALTCGTDESRLPNASCDVSSTRVVVGDSTAPTGDGAHPDARRARAAAIGEAIERYSALYVPDEHLRRATPRALGKRVVSPERFALFHPTQLADPAFPFDPFTLDSDTYFVEGRSLVDGHRAYVPAELVFMCCAPPDGTRRIGYTTSSGLACAPTLTEAILAALLELVERDAVMLAWKCGLSLPLVDWSRDDELLELERRFFECAPLSYSVLNGSRFLDVPVAIGVLRGPPRSGTALAVGAGCAAHPRDAWLKALSECFGVRSWLIVQSQLHPDRPAPSADDVRTFGHHMAFYGDDQNADLARFFDSSSERTPIDDVTRLEGSTPQAQIEAIVSRLARRGISAYAVDVSSPDVRELGLSVARVVAPELCALDVPHRARFLGGARLYHAAHRAGCTSAPLSVADLNPLPHPFP